MEERNERNNPSGMESLDSYNLLMMVNFVQEESIKELFKTKKWTCLYKVLPPSCSYLWGLYDDEKRPHERPTSGETTQDSGPKKLTENKDNYGAGNSSPVLNCKNSETVSNGNSTSAENDFEKTPSVQARWYDVKEDVKDTVYVKGAHRHDIDPSSSDTDDYDADNFDMNEILRCSELNKDNGQDENEKMESKKSKNDQTCLLADKKNKDKYKIKKNCLSSADVKDNDKKAIPSDFESVKKLKFSQSVLKSRGKNTCKKRNFSKDRRRNVSKNRLKEVVQQEGRERNADLRKSRFSKSSERCTSCSQFLYRRSTGSQTFCRSCREKCAYCEKTFLKTSTGLKSLEIHLRSHTGQRPFECCECHATFTSEEYLRRHKERKHNPEPELIACEICSRSFIKPYLKSHMVNMHSGKKASFKCDLCGNCFRYKGSLTQHKISVHAKQRDFLCDICSSSFTSSHNLRLHRVRHEADQKLTCNICGKILQGGSGFKEHMRRHANQRQYQCGKCPKSFYSKRDLLNHFKIHTGERPYKCHLCSYSCAIKGNLTKHMKRHRSGDMIPDHKYKGHCELEKVADNIGKIVYKEVDFRSDNDDVSDEEHEKDSDKTEISQSVEQHANVLHSNSEYIADAKDDRITRSHQNVLHSFIRNNGRTNHDSFTGDGQTNALVSMETNIFSEQVVHPSTSLTNTNYNIPMHLGLPVVYKDDQHLNQEQPNLQYSNVPNYYH